MIIGIEYFQMIGSFSQIFFEIFIWKFLVFSIFSTPHELKVGKKPIFWQFLVCFSVVSVQKPETVNKIYR